LGLAIAASSTNAARPALIRSWKVLTFQNHRHLVVFAFNTRVPIACTTKEQIHLMNRLFHRKKKEPVEGAGGSFRDNYSLGKTVRSLEISFRSSGVQ